MLVLFALAGPARADEPRETRLRWTIALQAAAYDPPLDSPYTADDAPFSSTFGTSMRVLGRLDLGLGAETPIGIWSLALGAGFWRATGRAQDLASALDPQQSGVFLQLIPLSIAIVWRVDVLPDLLSLPLVPYLRLGYGFVPWSAGHDSSSEVGRSGWAFGLEYGGGLQVVLDGLEPELAENARRELGLRSTSAFVEVTAMRWKDPLGPPFDGVAVGGGLLLVF